MSFLSYVSRINIEIGRSFIHRSFPRRVECLYLSEWGHTKLPTKQEKLHRLGSRFLCPPSSPFAPVSPFVSPFVSVFVTYLRLTFVVALLEGSSLFSFVRFFFLQPLYHPCLFTPRFTPNYCCLLLRFSLFVGARRRSILSGRSSLDQWPGRKLEHASTL